MIPRSIESCSTAETEIISDPLAVRKQVVLVEESAGLSLSMNIWWIMIAAAAFHVAYFMPGTCVLVILYLFALLQLARKGSGRKAFYCGLAVGMLIAMGRLDFFWNIFGWGCAALWLVYAIWIGFFVALARVCRDRFGSLWGSALIPFVWCGLEYFRSELYYLRFSWLSPGYAFALAPNLIPFEQVGTYGIGFLCAAVACIAAVLWSKSRIYSSLALCCGTGLLLLAGMLGRNYDETHPLVRFHVAGVQMEFPSEQEVLVRLNELVRKYPESELLVLSEYTFKDPIPDKVKTWCRQHRRYLIVGGKDPASGANYYDTGFVISPAGEIVFRQGKKVPIQFFKDGLPAAKQNLWNSPWGKIGIRICYDLSYSRVTDRLVEQGAQALIVPTMDVMDWGKRQHQLDARVAPLRAAEYRVPIFRVASSGISQLVDAHGHYLASAPCPGDGAMLSGVLELSGKGRLPLDRWLAPLATAVTGLVTLMSLIPRGQRARSQTGGSLT